MPSCSSRAEELHFERGGCIVWAAAQASRRRRALVITGKTIAGGSIGADVRAALGGVGGAVHGVLRTRRWPRSKGGGTLREQRRGCVDQRGRRQCDRYRKAVAVRLAGDVNAFRLDSAHRAGRCPPQRAAPCGATINGAGNVLLRRRASSIRQRAEDALRRYAADPALSCSMQTARALRPS